MSEIKCDGNCNGKIALWKVIMNRWFRKEYSQKKMYFCDECIHDSLEGPNSSNIKKIIKIKRKSD